MDTQASVATLHSQHLALLREQLLINESEPSQTHSQPEARSREQQLQRKSLGTNTDDDDVPRSLPATIQEFADAYLSPRSSPLKLKPQQPSKAFMSTGMEAVVQASPAHGISRAASYHGSTHHSEGDTQPMPSQVYREEWASMQRQFMMPEIDVTPVRPQATVDNEPWAGLSGDPRTDRTPHTLQEDESGYVDLATHFRESSPVNSTQAYDELLKSPSSPQTQLPAPLKSSAPETPALAGQKHNRDGELLTSVTTAQTKISWDVEPFGQRPILMNHTQLFAQTQAPSSPVAEGPRSDPIQSRPSPNMVERDDPFSPAQPNSSPIDTRRPPPTRMPGEPWERYKTVAEQSQARRMARTASEQSDVRDASDDGDDFEESSGQRRAHLKELKKLWSNEVMLKTSAVRAPMRPGSRPSSRPSSSRKLECIDLRTPAPIRYHQQQQCNPLAEHLDNDAADDESVDDEEEELPERFAHEEGDTEQAYQRLDDDIEDQRELGDDIDEYDELNQGLRSQANDPDESDDSGSMDDVQKHEDEHLDKDREQEASTSEEYNTNQDRPWTEVAHFTQRSTIADSQPTWSAAYPQPVSLQHVQHSFMASFVPGSQYTGKTSEEQALLPSSQHRSQTRLATSQIQATTASGFGKISSSPALPRSSNIISGDSQEASIARREALQRLVPRSSPPLEDSPTRDEIPESDIIDVEQMNGQNEMLETAFEAEETQGSNAAATFSTARTHASASARSPSKSMTCLSPVKAIASQQSRVTEPSPRKAAGVRHFAEMSSGFTPSNGSFEAADVDDVMNAVMTEEDRRVVGFATTTAESPWPKRRRLGRNTSQPGTSEVMNVTASREQPATAATTEECWRPVSEVSMAIANSKQDLSLSETSPQILKDSPSKANELAPTSSEHSTRSDTTSESTHRRERQGADVVSQLIAARPTAASKKTKQVTYSRVTKTKPINTKRSAKCKTKRHIRNTSHENFQPAVLGSAVRLVDESAQTLNDTETGDTAKLAPDATVATDHKASEGASSVIDGNTGIENCEDPVIMPSRIFALFKGTYFNFYPATWLDSSANGMTYKVRFDDTTITDIETSHVRRLDLQVGDLVKVDIAGMKTKTWRVIGFGTTMPITNVQELGVDIRGHSLVKVQAKTTRNSVAKDASGAIIQGESEITEVPVSQIYLTKTMWPSFTDRLFSPPSKERADLDYAGTPATRPGTPILETPSFKSHRTVLPPAKLKAGAARTSQLREASITSSAASSSSAMFCNMAFAISYIANEKEKADVTELLRQNGGTILYDGFEELFELPNIGEAAIASPRKTTPTKKASKEQKPHGLQLKEEYANLRFVALIADRHSRKAKYMQALALGLPTLSGRWITDSLNVLNKSAPTGEAVTPLGWDRYLLPAGESSHLGGAIRSRTLALYNAASAQLETTIAARSVLLNGESVLIVAPKKGKASWDKRKTYAFLTLALGAGQVKRVNDLQEALAVIQVEPEEPKWVYVDGTISEARAALFGRPPVGKKRKRDSNVVTNDGNNMCATHGHVRVVNDEFVVQSLILGALTE